MSAGRNYQRKGDPFTLKVRRGEGPPCVIRWARVSTGRDYFTRVPVHRCPVLRARDAAGAVREYAAQVGERRGGEAPDVPSLAPLLAFDWHPSENRVTVALRRDPTAVPGAVRVVLGVTPTGRPGAHGARVWLACPRCGRRCGAVYASRWGQWGEHCPQPVTGCRVCLGLTDESRQRHKTLDWAGAVEGSRTFTPDRYGHYRAQSEVTRLRAQGVMLASMRRAFPGMFSGPSGQR